MLDQTAAWLHGAATHATPSGGLRPTQYLAPRLSLVIMTIGSRGDVQPFIPIGQRLAWRHRVRIATHAEFRPMVERAGLEFYPLAGDPRELMEYMIKTGGRIVPMHVQQIVEDVPRKRQMIADILESTWRACTEKDPEHPDAKPFVADGIIANPPSYGHFHCAEALRIPLHIVCSMPWTPTSAFPHPFAHLSPGAHHPVRNWFSYNVMDLLMWVGVADLINRFRQHTLGLPPIELRDGAATLLSDNEVPFTYLFPASLIPKPADWGPHIDLANFIFFDQASTYRPPPDLLRFLAAGERPIYVGFGSCIVQDPAAVSRTIFAALEQAGARGIVSRGWGHLGGTTPPAHVYLIDDCPHDWLFPRCRAVCHHGGAGTTSAGLRAGLPTVVVPFFGDQFFWGQVVLDAGAGPKPIPIETLNSDRLAEAFAACARPEMRTRAEELGARIRAEDGVELVFESLRRHLPLPAMHCARDPEHLATLYCAPCRLRLCQSCYDGHHRGHPSQPYRYVDWSVRERPGIAKELRDLIADAANALRASIDEFRPMAAPRRHGVLIGDTETPSDEAGDEPVRRRER
jgi:UDP:flavonoid glycosyltransferase YjiC (YdhE family)